MLFINVLAAFYERMKYDNNYVHYFNITLKTRLAPGCLEDGLLLGARRSPHSFASDSSMIHSYFMATMLNYISTVM